MKIEIKNIKKSFKKIFVLKDINMILEGGKIYGFRGRNGSGKSVLLKIICNLLNPTSGQIMINNKEIKGDIYKYNVGALIENPSFFGNLTGYENLKLLSELQKKIGEKEINKALEKVNLIEEKDKLYKNYSLGMKQKLGIAQAIMENQNIIILDEPFNGIEENTVKKIKEILKKLSSEGKLIIISSHIKEDLEELADEIYFFDNGNVTKE